MANRDMAGAQGWKQWAKRAIIFYLLSEVFLFGWTGLAYYQGLETSSKPIIKMVDVDLRAYKNATPFYVEIATRRANLADNRLVGHMWVRWPSMPADPRVTDKVASYGYYASDFWQGARAMAATLVIPFGILIGQNYVPGDLRVDYEEVPERRIRLIVDQNAYQKILATHEQWRHQNLYSVWPGVFGPRHACQDYAYDIASSAGLKTPHRHWAEFPFESFNRLAQENQINFATAPEVDWPHQNHHK